jgi:hypothetical protein
MFSIFLTISTLIDTHLYPQQAENDAVSQSAVASNCHHRGFLESNTPDYRIKTTLVDLDDVFIRLRNVSEMYLAFGTHNDIMFCLLLKNIFMCNAHGSVCRTRLDSISVSVTFLFSFSIHRRGGTSVASTATAKATILVWYLPRKFLPSFLPMPAFGEGAWRSSVLTHSDD